MKMIWWIKFIGVLIALVVLYFIIVIAWAYFTQYHPKKEIQLEVVEKSPAPSLDKDSIIIYTWNIGYAGLDKNSDFFYDGGKMVRPDKQKVQANFAGIQSEISTWSDADIVLLQEVDEKAKRSWKIPEKDEIIRQQNKFTQSVFATNYQVRYVPKPYFEPMGQVSSGILTLSKWNILSATRVSYPGSFSFPTGLFFLNRCFSISRIPYFGRELVIINTHNSAFDGGVLKKQEMEFLKPYLIREYEKGNFVIVGGDWNQVQPGFVTNQAAKYEETPVPTGYPQNGWQWVADSTHRSNRKVDTPYIKGVTYTTNFDFFLISPNVEVLSIEGLERNFEFSDHEPVKIQIKVKR